MNNSTKISFILPVYNCEKFIGKCIEKLLYVNNSEIIIIDDGSKDDTLKIVERLKSEFSNITVIVKEKNEGVVAARMDGIRTANGEYIAFVDGDDWINFEFYDKAICELESDISNDIVVGKAIRYYDDNHQEIICDFDEKKKLDNINAIEELFVWNYYRWELWGKLYRKSLFDNIKPDYSVKICEDLDMSWQVFKKSRGTLILPIIGYYYYCNINSACFHRNLLYDGSEKVFETIMKKDYGLLSKKSAIIFRNHYICTLVNKIRENILMGYNEQHLLMFQSKLRDVLKFCNGEDDNYYNLFHIAQDPIMAQQTVDKVTGGIIDLFEHIINSGGKPCIYGTGIVADFVYRVLPIEYRQNLLFVVSDDQFSREEFHGISVKYISGIDRQDDIVLALNEKTQYTVKENLIGMGFYRIYHIFLYGII